MSSKLVLCLGDLFIPDRAPDIPAKFKKLLVPGKISQTLCLGNLTSPDPFIFLRGIAPDFNAVKGDFDVDPFPHSILHSQPSQRQNAGQQGAAHAVGATAPLTKIVTHGRLRIGLTHGHTIVPHGDPDALLIAARQMDADVLLWSGGTHRFEAFEMEGRFFVNPGSATGALGTGWWAEGEVPIPSFVLMDIQNDLLTIYVYQLKRDPQKPGEEGESVTVEKVSYRKPAPPPEPARERGESTGDTSTGSG